ncbi:MAG: cystathionine beta-lyase [Ottowia sp.]|nr:cystathionine beta-lyase [Ottowia sp.]
MDTECVVQTKAQPPLPCLPHLRVRIPKGFASLSPPVWRASTVLFPNMEALRQYHASDEESWSYGLQSTPTQYELAQKLAQIEGGYHSLLLPSGLAAFSLIQFTFLRHGDGLLIPDSVYFPNRTHAEWLMRDFGIKVQFYDPMNLPALSKLITAKTKLIFIEAPGSITMEVPDIPAITALAQSRGVITAIDNTWSGGLLCRPFDLGVDITMQALTKYQSGGSDVLMGSIVTRELRLHDQLRTRRRHMGWGVSSDDCYFLLRSLPSMAVRIAQHGANAQALANWLNQRKEVVRVLHPALPDCAGHAFWQRDFSGASGLFSVVFNKRYRQTQVDAFIEDLQLFGIGYSWGGAHSLVMHYDVLSQRSIAVWPPTEWHDRDEVGCLVRLYCGLESPAELIADVEQSMSRHLV